MRPISFASVLVVSIAVAQAPSVVSPVAAASGPGQVSNWMPFGAGQATYQQVHSAWSFSSTSARTFRALRFRPWTWGSTATIDVELHMERARVDSKAVDATFANNVVAGSEVNVFTRKPFVLPNISSADWFVRFPFDRPFAWNGTDLEWRAVVHGNNNGNQPTYYAIDAFSATSAGRQTGSFAGCASALGTQAASQSVRVRSPGMVSQFTGMSYVTAGGLPAALNLGLSETRAGGVPLPFDLTPFGAPGCEITNDIVASLVGTTAPGTYGTAAFDVRVPNLPGLAGVRFYSQLVFLQPGANALGAFLTPGKTNTIGRNHGLSRVAGAYGATSGSVELQTGLAIGLD